MDDDTKDEDMDENRGIEPLRYDQTGLRGKRLRVLVAEPTNDAGYDADLPAGITQVITIDDEPNPNLTLRVHPPDDPARIAYVRYDQLALVQE
jgi:hypothetical protein